MYRALFFYLCLSLPLVQMLGLWHGIEHAQLQAQASQVLAAQNSFAPAHRQDVYTLDHRHYCVVYDAATTQLGACGSLLLAANVGFFSVIVVPPLRPLFVWALEYFCARAPPSFLYC
jgi:hypothetical protein